MFAIVEAVVTGVAFAVVAVAAVVVVVVAVLFFLAVGMFLKRFHQRIVFPIVSLPVLVALYALFDFSWKAIIIWGVAGYLLQCVSEWWKKRREESGESV